MKLPLFLGAVVLGVLGLVVANLFIADAAPPVDAGQTSPIEHFKAEKGIVKSGSDNPHREQAQGLPTVEAMPSGASKDASHTSQPSLSEGLQSLQSLIAEPLPGANLEAEFLEKYRGLEPEQLLLIYPVIRDLQSKEMTATLERAIESGQYLTEVVSAGERVDFEKYRYPGSTMLTVAHQSEPLGNGLVEHRIVPIDQDHFPEMYARTFEECWLHDRIDEAGICPYCKKPSSVVITEHREATTEQGR